MRSIGIHSWVTPKQGVKTIGGWQGNGIVIAINGDFVQIDPDDGSDTKLFLMEELRRVDMLRADVSIGSNDDD